MTGKTASQKKVKVSARIARGPLDWYRKDQASEQPIFGSLSEFLDFGAKLTTLVGQRGAAVLKSLQEAL